MKLDKASAWRVWGAIALALLPMTYAGFISMRNAAWMMAQPGINAEASRYQLLWQSNWGGERAKLSVSLRERERRIFDRVLAQARAEGFVFRDPMATQTTREADMLEPLLEGHRVYGTAYPSGRILLSTEDMDRMDDGEVAILMAHEVGHQIDFQTERVGHELLYRLRNADREVVAWEFAKEFCGAQPVKEWRAKWQKKPWMHYLH